MNAFDPFKLAAFWIGMALGIPMLASELAAEVWGTRSKPAPVPAEKPAVGMTRRVEDIQTRFSTEGLAEVKADFDGDWSQEPIILTPGRIEELPPGFAVCRDLPVYLASDDLPPPSSSIEVETPLHVWDPAPKPRKRKS